MGRTIWSVSTLREPHDPILLPDWEIIMVSPSYCSWLRLLAPLFKSRLRPGTGTTPLHFIPMAVLRNETLAYKPENTSSATSDAAHSPSSVAAAPPASFRAVPASPPPCPPASSVAQPGPLYHAQPLRHDLSLTGCTPHTMPSPPFVLSGTIQDVCNQLEQWAAQEDRWLQTG